MRANGAASRKPMAMPGSPLCARSDAIQRSARRWRRLHRPLQLEHHSINLHQPSSPPGRPREYHSWVAGWAEGWSRMIGKQNRRRFARAIGPGVRLRGFAAHETMIRAGPPGRWSFHALSATFGLRLANESGVCEIMRVRALSGHVWLAMLTAFLCALLTTAFAARAQEQACGLDNPCSVRGGEYYLAFPPGWDGKTALPAVLYFHSIVRRARAASRARRSRRRSPTTAM